jgi:DNA-binding beta-propeller fold protein YncE
VSTAERRRRVKLGCYLVCAVAAAACAAPMSSPTFHPLATLEDETLWPEPPEVPRYRYAGQLIGEANFKSVSGSEESAGSRFARWIIGLGRNSTARPETLLRPQAGAVDPDGRIFVSDVGRRAVFVFDMSGGELQVWERADRGTHFDAPIGVAITDNGEVLVADAGLKRVVRLSPEGRPLGSFGAEVLERPTGLAWSRGRAYVADSAADDVKVFDGAGRLTGRIGGRGVKAGELNGPTHLTFVDDLLYVSDTLNARVQVFDTAGSPIRQIGNRGLYVGNFTRPKGVAVDGDGNVYVVESYYDHVVIFDQAGNYLLPIRGADVGVGYFYLPAGVWSDAADRIFLADMYNGRVIILQYLGH